MSGASESRMPTVRISCPPSLKLRRTFGLFQKPVNIGSFGVQDTYRSHLLQDAVEGLFGGAAAGLGFAEDLFEFGGDEVLAREDTAFVPRGDALDGGGDAFVPSHVAQFKQSLNCATSLGVEEFGSLRVGAGAGRRVKEFKSCEFGSSEFVPILKLLNSQTLKLRPNWGTARRESRPTFDTRPSTLGSRYCLIPPCSINRLLVIQPVFPASVCIAGIA